MCITTPSFSFISAGPVSFVYRTLRCRGFAPQEPVGRGNRVSGRTNGTRERGLFRSSVTLVGSYRVVLTILLCGSPKALVRVKITMREKVPILICSPCSVTRGYVLARVPGMISTSTSRVVSRLFGCTSGCKGEAGWKDYPNV